MEKKNLLHPLFYKDINREKHRKLNAKIKKAPALYSQRWDSNPQPPDLKSDVVTNTPHRQLVLC